MIKSRYSILFIPLVLILFAFSKDFKLLKPLELSEKEKLILPLGEALFKSNLLSKNKNISCASCHNEKNGFGGVKQFDVGTNGDTLERHTPHLFNLSLGTSFFWDGRVNTLEAQFLEVLSSPKEMDLGMDTLVERLKNDVLFSKKFDEIFNRPPNQKNITKAMVIFEKSLFTNESKYDSFLVGNELALNKQEKKGMELFKGKANCIKCHFGKNLTDNEFHNTGVVTEDIGRQLIDQIGEKKEFEMRPYPFFSTYKAFKTPSLRNLELHPPYFHDGSKSSLEEVVEFYSKGGENPDKKGLAKDIKPLNLSEEEKKSLVSFLKSLTDKKYYE